MRSWGRRAAALAVALGFTLSLCPQPVHAEYDGGVLIMAQGGDRSWKSTVRKAVKQAKLPYPYRIYFGAGDSASGHDEVQTMVEELEDEGANTIYVVPLVISSYTEMVRQWKYLLGVDVQPGYMNTPLFPIRKKSAIRFTDPLNESAVVVEILLDRAHDISSQPSNESVIIVSRGAKDHADNDRWLENLRSISARLKERGNYKTVEAVTLRDDAPSATRTKAVDYLRQRVKAAEAAGNRALVITFLLSNGGLEHRIGLELRGSSYAFNTKALLPDARISEWIRSQVP